MINFLDRSRFGRQTTIESLAFSLDGRRLVASNFLGKIWVWDGSALGPEIRSYREAMSTARFHLHKAQSEADYRGRIAQDSIISDEIRSQSLQLAKGLWEQEAINRSERLNNESWYIVKLSDGKAAAYSDALTRGRGSLPSSAGER